MSSRSCAASASRSICISSSLMAAAPMLALKRSPNLSRASRYSRSESKIYLYSRPVSPGSVTIYDAKYSTRSRSLALMSNSWRMRLGAPRKYQMCETGAASSMWPMRSRRTLARVTSTPHLSQMMPL